MGKKLSDTLQKDFEEVTNIMQDFMMHTEMIKDEASDNAAKVLSKSWNNLDNAYENFQNKVKMFIRAQKAVNESAGPRNGKTFKDFYLAEKTKIVTEKFSDGHWHDGIVDDEGDGKTTKTLPKGHKDHVHNIVGAEIEAAGKKKHTHLIKA